jgi:phosphoserine phosphatase
MTKAGAFFDLDRTLMAGSSGIHFGRAAYRSGMVSRSQLTRWAIDHVRYRLRGSTDADTEELVRQVKELLDGVPERQLRRLVPDLLAGILPRIYPQMIDEVRAHQDEGRPTFIVSAAGDGIVKLLAGVLDMEGGIGTRYSIDEEGNFTGLLNPVAVNPDAELAAIAKQRGWRVMRFEKLGRRLAVGATVLAAGAIGGSGTWLAARRRPRKSVVSRRR